MTITLTIFIRILYRHCFYNGFIFRIKCYVLLVLTSNITKYIQGSAFFFIFTPGRLCHSELVSKKRLIDAHRPFAINSPKTWLNLQLKTQDKRQTWFSSFKTRGYVFTGFALISTPFSAVHANIDVT